MTFLDLLGCMRLTIVAIGTELASSNVNRMGDDCVNEARTISLFLCGDVMTGRGIDQVLPYPVRPVLYEP